MNRDRSEVMEILREAASWHGFEFSEDEWGERITDGKDWSSAWVNFHIAEEQVGEFVNEEEVYCDMKIVVSASVSRMGGNHTVEDLRKAADVISRAANLVEELSAKELTYRRYFVRKKNK